MNDSATPPDTSQDLVETQKNQPALPASVFPGFALPEAALHSIPLPAEFEQLVQAALQENRVVSPLPKFFNGIFRRQGVVNKHTIHALESVGHSLTHLAREIESRDRVLEKLAAHLNTYGEHVHRGQMTLAHFSQELASQLGEVAGTAHARMDRESERSRTHVESLVAKARSTERRLGDLQNLGEVLNAQIADLKNSNERRLKETVEPLQNELRGLKSAQQEGETALARLRTESERIDRKVSDTLPAAEERIVRRLVELTTPVQQDHAQLKAEFLARREESQAADAALEARIQTLVDHVNEQRTVSTQQTTSIEALLLQFAEFEKRAAATSLASEEARREAASALVAASARLETELSRQRDQLKSEIVQHVADLRSTTDSRLDGIQKELESDRATATALAHSIAGDRLTFADGLAGVEARFAAVEQQVATRLEALELHLKCRTFESEQKQGELLARESSIASSLRASTQKLDVLGSDFAELRNNLANLAEITADLSTRLTATESTLLAPASKLNVLLPSLRAQLEQLQATALPASRELLAAQATQTIDDARAAQADGLYVALEARFRGPRALIRDRQSKYLPWVEEARKRVEMFPPRALDVSRTKPAHPTPGEDGVIDLGCGRGEWIELLKDNKIPALGVDRNRFFLQTCRQRECAVVDADVMKFLRSAADESVAVVTSFHVIEHLPIPVMEEMISQVFRVLRRGGMVIFETPNPANVLTSSLNFLLDPTHLRPVHPELARLLVEMAGFASVRLEFLSPYEASQRVQGENDALTERFNHYFYGPQDYAVIGVKP